MEVEDVRRLGSADVERESAKSISKPASEEDHEPNGARHVGEEQVRKVCESVTIFEQVNNAHRVAQVSNMQQVTKLNTNWSCGVEEADLRRA